MSVRLILGAGLSILVGAAGAETRLLAEDEIVDLLSGNTLHSVHQNADRHEHFLRNGVIITKTSAHGSWWVRDGLLCLGGKGPQRSSGQHECHQVAREGDVVHFLSGDGRSQWTATLLKGNPANLPVGREGAAID